MTDLVIDEILVKKLKLELDTKKLLLDFMKETGVKVDLIDCELTRLKTKGGSCYVYYDLIADIRAII